MNSRPLVECVPNFSEGRDPAIVQAIAKAIASTNVAILDQTMDRDHNRSVVTFAGAPENVAEAAFRGIREAVRRIDLRFHSGVHPRIGAADVVPFVPVQGVTLQDCVGIAWRTGQRVWDELQVPVYFYEAAARRPWCVDLAEVRQGQFEGLLEEAVRNPDRRPDIGGPNLHQTAGAVAIGARKFLIAFNINLATADVSIARSVARAVRQSSGGLPCVKALGLPLASRNLAQVSLNLTDFEQTPIAAAFEAVRAEAEQRGVAVVSTELIGLLPRKALDEHATWFRLLEKFEPGRVLETRIEQETAS
ncbi:MAG TPA: glutamate formimidoyltransferase [Bryobacteraceae bacterium]|nr:glutamate formimidoyltransferase [Bryobacteraceae bacterium]